MSQADIYARRRQRVMEQIGPHAALVVAASPELVVGADTELRYVIDPDLYYLTGHTEPEAVAVLCPALDSPFTLFVRPRDAAREQWTGVRGGLEAATGDFGADAAHESTELATQLPAMLEAIDTVYARLSYGRSDVDAAVLDTIRRGRRRAPRKGRGARAILDPGLVLDDLRVIKDAAELGCLRKAADITVDVFREAAAVMGDGVGEWQIEATIDGGFRVRGAAGSAFPTIVASGANAIVLHHVANNGTLRAGEMVLVDAGARHEMYCADVSRTFPVSGTFSSDQRRLYDAVLQAHDAAISTVRPGATIADVHDAALRCLVEGLVEIGLLNDSVDALIEAGDDVRRFFPHKTSHWLGLDVHDVGAYMIDDRPRVLETGMVLTIEPGLYVPRDAATGPAALRGTGIRIEDDVLVTGTGHEVLTRDLPVDAEAVEALLA